MNIRAKILLTSGLVFLIGCTSVENKLIDTPVYTKNGKAYNVLDDKAINGVIKKSGYYGAEEFYTYKKGRLLSLKKISQSQELIYDISFDDMGLKEGILSEKDGKTTTYSHGILDGKQISKDYLGNTIVARYSDGVLDGEQENAKGEKEYYTNGVKTTKDLMTITKKQSKKVILGETPENNFTGELYGKAKKDITKNYYVINQVEEYKDGMLLSRKYYDKTGIKLEEFNFADGNIKNIVRSIKYNRGVLLELKNYNLNGDLNGSYIISNYYPKYTETKHYIDGIPHGKVERLVTTNNEGYKVIGIYDKGIYSGTKREQNYKDGVEVDEKINALYSSKLKIIATKDIANKSIFTGYTKDSLSKETITPKNLYYYSNGILKEKYEYKNNSLVQYEYYLSDGRSIRTTYKDGLVKVISNYDAKGIQNGQVISYEHSDSKTISYVVNGVISGRSTHYHGGKVYYIDEYSKDRAYKRTIYYDYKKKQIKEINQGAWSGTNWVLKGIIKSYYESGKLKKVIDYGDKLVATKKVKVTEYYKNGKIKSKSQKDYCLCETYGKKIEYYENGKKKTEENFDGNGRKSGVFKTYNEKGKLIKQVNYENGYQKN